ncbi:MAG: RnfABCDGE type electron transport complex subunit E [Anaerolineaceae bacterium]|nr:RnfABCDGE type electron transport complex subunit E [Anaerolineaceae bacterium]
MDKLLKPLVDKAVKSNPVFVLMLGLCPTLAVTTSVKNALAMAGAASTVLLCSNLLISLIKNIVPKEVRIACYIVVIAGFVTMVEILMKALLPPEINAKLGIFIPLIVVNCIILGRAEAFASRNGVLSSIGDAIGIGLGFAGALTLIGLVRETIGNGTLWGYALWSGYGKGADAVMAPATLAIMAPGAFIAIGLLFGLFNSIGNRRKAARLAGLEPVTFQTSADQKARQETEPGQEPGAAQA